MARGNTIVLADNPKGVPLEGTIGDTSKPGTLMQVKAATALINGRPTWVSAAVGTDGAPQLIAVLMEDSLQGKLMTDAYVANTRCFLYAPIAGEECNVLAGEAAGTTGNNFAIGDRLMVDSDLGNLIPSSGSPVSVPFISMETATNVAEPYLLWCMYTGH